MNIISFFLGITILLYSGFIIIHLVCWFQLPRNTETEREHKFSTAISVLIPVRNEEKNITKCLASILEQDYPKELMEIILCDDQSDDQTKEEALRILNEAGVNYKYAEVTSVRSNKKIAIDTGIKLSSGKLLIFTDGDCTAEKTWISTIASAYEESGANMLCGPVAITGEKTFFSQFQSLEMCGLSLLSGAGINAGIPLLCNGANLAYTRETYNSVGGFEGIDDIPTGDDTLLLFKIHNKFPGTIHYVKSRRAVVYATAQTKWKVFFHQRIRWASKGFHAKNRLNTATGLLVFFTNFLLFFYAFLAFFFQGYSTFFLSCILLKSVIDFLLLTFAAVFFRKNNLLSYFILSEIITIMYVSLIGLMAYSSAYEWKGRKYNSK